jgi:hypothetical protein
MPVSWRISDGLVFLESDDPVTFAEWQAAIDAALANKDYRPGMGVLHDQRRLKRAPSIEEGKARVHFVAGRGIRRWAVLAAGDATYGMGRMGEALSASTTVEIRAFRNPAEAEAWARRSGEE